jgi:hypothetical protein
MPGGRIILTMVRRVQAMMRSRGAGATISIRRH